MDAPTRRRRRRQPTRRRADDATTCTGGRRSDVDGAGPPAPSPPARRRHLKVGRTSGERPASPHTGSALDGGVFGAIIGALFATASPCRTACSTEGCARGASAASASASAASGHATVAPSSRRRHEGRADPSSSDLAPASWRCPVTFTRCRRRRGRIATREPCWAAGSVLVCSAPSSGVSRVGGRRRPLEEKAAAPQPSALLVRPPAAVPQMPKPVEPSFRCGGRRPRRHQICHLCAPPDQQGGDAEALRDPWASKQRFSKFLSAL